MSISLHVFLTGCPCLQSSDFSQATADVIDSEVKAIVEKAYRRAKDLVITNMDVLHETAAVLMERENIDGDEFQAIIMNSKARQYLKEDEPTMTIPYK